MNKNNIQSQILEEAIKQLGNTLIELASFKIRNKQQLNQIKANIKSHRNLTQMTQFLIEVVSKLIMRQIHHNPQDLEHSLQDSLPNHYLQSFYTSAQYYNLQSQIQKIEVKNKELIRKDLQLKLYCEDLQHKLYQSEKANQQLLRSTKEVITNLKRQNQMLMQKNSKIQKRYDLDNIKTNIKEYPNKKTLESISMRNSSFASIRIKDKIQ